MQTAADLNVIKPELRIIRMPDVRFKTSLSPAHIFNLINAGQFPKPFHLTPGSRAVGWLESTVDDWINKRAQEIEHVE